MDTIKTRLVIQVPNLMKVQVDLNEKTINLILEKTKNEFEFTTESQAGKLIISINNYSTITHWFFYLMDELTAIQDQALPYDDFIYEFIEKLINYLENDKRRKKDNSFKEYLEDIKNIKPIIDYLLETHNIPIEDEQD
jgi:hypothetical protein